MGAAILAAAGYFNREGEVSKNMVSIKRVIEPSTSPVEQGWTVSHIFAPVVPSECMKLLISDLDGTIVETEDYHRLYNALFKELGLSQNWSKQDYMDRLQTMGGNKFRRFFLAGIAEEEYEETKTKLYHQNQTVYELITADLIRSAWASQGIDDYLRGSGCWHSHSHCHRLCWMGSGAGN